MGSVGMEGWAGVCGVAMWLEGWVVVLGCLCLFRVVGEAVVSPPTRP